MFGRKLRIVTTYITRGFLGSTAGTEDKEVCSYLLMRKCFGHESAQVNLERISYRAQPDLAKSGMHFFRASCSYELSPLGRLCTFSIPAANIVTIAVVHTLL